MCALRESRSNSLYPTWSQDESDNNNKNNKKRSFVEWAWVISISFLQRNKKKLDTKCVKKQAYKICVKTDLLVSANTRLHTHISFFNDEGHVKQVKRYEPTEVKKTHTHTHSKNLTESKNTFNATREMKKSDVIRIWWILCISCVTWMRLQDNKLLPVNKVGKKTKNQESWVYFLYRSVKRQEFLASFPNSFIFLSFRADRDDNLTLCLSLRNCATCMGRKRKKNSQIIETSNYPYVLIHTHINIHGPSIMRRRSLNGLCEVKCLFLISFSSVCVCAHFHLCVVWKKKKNTNLSFYGRSLCAL